MRGEQDSSTSLTLLFRLRNPTDQSAWNEFVHRYRQKIYRWCRRYGLQDADAEDVTQTVLSQLVKGIQSFEPSLRFRPWLKAVTQNAVRAAVKSRHRAAIGTGNSDVGEALAAIQAPEAVGALEEELAAEHQRELELLKQAEREVKQRVKRRTWEAYRLTERLGRPAPGVAESLGMAISEVYVAKSRVRTMVRETALKLAATEPVEKTLVSRKQRSATA